ncbi:unknown [Subdoligranulum sp. CAG:314]|nr:unknown [Subdoligranulum sp. CAG:314]
MFSVKLEIDDKTPKKTAYTAKFPKSFKTFWDKEKPTLKQIRQLSLSYLQNSSCFDVVGNKGLARSGSDGAASNVCERHKIRPQLLYCRDGRATRRSSDFLAKRKIRTSPKGTSRFDFANTEIKNPKSFKELFGKGETDVKANKTAKAVLFAKFVAFRRGGQ